MRMAAAEDVCFPAKLYCNRLESMTAFRSPRNRIYLFISRSLLCRAPLLARIAEAELEP